MDGFPQIKGWIGDNSEGRPWGVWGMSKRTGNVVPQKTGALYADFAFFASIERRQAEIYRDAVIAMLEWRNDRH